jgi:Na+-transporting NADH:ubiquinone oxidoreductase subunit NqrC
MPNTNQTLFIVIFSLIAAVIVLATYVIWLKRIKMKTKIYEQKQVELVQQQNQLNNLTPAQLQELKPALLQKLYGSDFQKQPNQSTMTQPISNV